MKNTRWKRGFKLWILRAIVCLIIFAESEQYHDPNMVLKETGRRSTGRKSASDSEMQSVCVEIL